MTGTLEQALANADNNYRDLVAKIVARTGLAWHDPTPSQPAAGTRLSVVIPAHNCDYSLATVLDALAVQDTEGTVEIIVIDDASTDDTTQIARHHPVVDVAYRLKQRVGAGAARNLGTCLAESETIVYLDADMVLPPHVLADLAVRADPNLVLVGFRHNIPYVNAGHQRATVPAGEPLLEADHRVRWEPPAGRPMFYSGQVYPQRFTGHPLADTDEFVGLGHAAIYHDWDLPRMLVTALVAVPRSKVLEVGGFDPGFDAFGWGTEDTHLGAALIAAGCKIAPLRQVRGFHIDPPDPHGAWQAKFATAADRIDYYRHLLTQPAPLGRADELAAQVQRLLLENAEELR